jgi:Fe2+ transport system protein B
MGARTMENPRDRMLSIMMAPFMSCSARLPVYILFATAFYPHNGQNVVFTLYLIGIAVAILTAVIMKRTLLPGATSPFIMELPDYHRPFDLAVHRIEGANNGLFCKDTREDTYRRWPVFFRHAHWGEYGRNCTTGFAQYGFIGILMSEGAISAHGVQNAQYRDNKNVAEAQGMAATNLDIMRQLFATQAAAIAYLLLILLYTPCVAALGAIYRETNMRWTVFIGSWTFDEYG